LALYRSSLRHGVRAAHPQLAVDAFLAAKEKHAPPEKKVQTATILFESQGTSNSIKGGLNEN
jgi:hypothetical protein